MKITQAQSNRVGANLSVRPLICLALLPLLIVLGAGDASAQGQADTPKSSSLSDIHQLEEIVVTATRRTESVMDVPFSVNVQEEADIQRLNTFSLEGLSRNIAGLSIQNLGPGQNVMTIRGISSGQIVRDQPGVKEQVGVYLDDTPISRSRCSPRTWISMTSNAWKPCGVRKARCSDPGPSAAPFGTSPTSPNSASKRSRRNST